MRRATKGASGRPSCCNAAVHAPSVPRRAVIATALALSLALAVAGCGGDSAAKPGPGGERRVDLAGGSATAPPAWNPLDAASLGLVEGGPDAALRRRDGTAILSVRRGEKPPAAIGEHQAKLLRELRPRVPDLLGLSAKEVRTEAGAARSFTVQRGGPTGLARVVVVPDGDGSFVLELAITSTEGPAAQEAGRIIRSFKAED